MAGHARSRLRVPDQRLSRQHPIRTERPRRRVTHSCSELYSSALPLRSDMQAVLPARIALSRQLVANSPHLRTVGLPRPSPQRSILAVHSTEQSLFTTTRRGGSSSNAWHRPVTDLPQRMWQGYLAHLSKNPLTTKAVTAWFGACLGDLLAQACAGGPFDLARNVRLGLFALCAGGPMGHYWHRFLDRQVMPQRSGSMRAVLSKLAADQLLLTPIFTAIFLSYLKISEGRIDLVMPYLQDKLFKTLKANYALWPVANLIAFRFVPGDLRILYCNAIGVLWGAYISVLCYTSGAGAPVQAELLDTQQAHSVAESIA